MYMRAFDVGGNPIGEDRVDPSLQFDLLTVAAPGIARIELFDPVGDVLEWDDLTFSRGLPEPSAATLMAFAFATFATCRQRLRYATQQN
jgi:hypothetical protein